MAPVLIALAVLGLLGFLARRKGVSWGGILLGYFLFSVFSYVFSLLGVGVLGGPGFNRALPLLIPVGVIVSILLSMKATPAILRSTRRLSGARHRVLRGSSVVDERHPTSEAGGPAVSPGASTRSGPSLVRGSEVVSRDPPATPDDRRPTKAPLSQRILPFLIFGVLFLLFAAVILTTNPHMSSEEQFLFFGFWAGVPALLLTIMASRALRRKRDRKEPANEDGASPIVSEEPVPRELVLGGIPLDPALESQHFLFAGATGSGKTQGINLILATARARGARVIVADSGGGALSRFFREGDRILNPLDARTEEWSPFAEIREKYDCERIAKAVIPDATGDSQEWHHYARMLVAELLRAMWTHNMFNTQTFLELLTSKPGSELAVYLNATPAQIFCQEGNEKMLANTRAIIGAYLSVWSNLKDDGRFSVRDWIRSEGDHSWLFVTYRDDQFALLRPLIGAWLDLAIVEGLALDEDQPREIWFVMDEVDSLGKISHLRQALTKLRKYGCKCVLGLQTVSQLRSTYGRDEAQTLMANVGTKIVLRAGDGETAEYFSSEFGSQEIERVQSNKSKTRGGRGSRTEGETNVRETRRTVLDSEISGLRDLHGYLKLPGSLLQIQFEYRKRDRVTDSFVPKREGNTTNAKA